MPRNFYQNKEECYKEKYKQSFRETNYTMTTYAYMHARDKRKKNTHFV